MTVAQHVVSENGEISQTVTLCNRRGLHARASAKLARMAEAASCEIWVKKDGQTVTASSIMGLMMLGAACGDDITIVCSGQGAQEILSDITALIEDQFGEGE